MTEIQSEIAGILPLRVTDYGITNPFFNIYGADWSLAINCDWSLVDGTEVVATWESAEDAMEEAVAALKGRSIVEVRVGDGQLDPVFVFDDGVALVVEADTDLDPWVLRAEGLSAVLVGLGPGSRS